MPVSSKARSARTTVLDRPSRRSAPAGSVYLQDAMAVLLHAADTFGDREAAAGWLRRFHPLLGAKPIDLLSTRTGRRKVDDELGRIDHGIF